MPLVCTVQGLQSLPADQSGVLHIQFEIVETSAIVSLLDVGTVGPPFRTLEFRMLGLNAQ